MFEAVRRHLTFDVSVFAGQRPVAQVADGSAGPSAAGRAAAMALNRDKVRQEVLLRACRRSFKPRLSRHRMNIKGNYFPHFT